MYLNDVIKPHCSGRDLWIFLIPSKLNSEAHRIKPHFYQGDDHIVPTAFSICSRTMKNFIFRCRREKSCNSVESL